MRNLGRMPRNEYGNLEGLKLAAKASQELCVGCIEAFKHAHLYLEAWTDRAFGEKTIGF